MKKKPARKKRGQTLVTSRRHHYSVYVIELSPEVLDSDRSLVMDQVDSGVAVRMAALALCLRARVSA